MVLYLSSYKLGNKTTYLKNWIKKYSNKILLIPNSRDAKVQNNIEKENINENIKMLEDIGFEVTILDLKKYFNDSKSLNKELKDYNAFCVIGGNVFVLRQAMKLSGFDKFLINNSSNKDILYIGDKANTPKEYTKYKCNKHYIRRFDKSKKFICVYKKQNEICKFEFEPSDILLSRVKNLI